MEIDRSRRQISSFDLENCTRKVFWILLGDDWVFMKITVFYFIVIFNPSFYLQGINLITCPKDFFMEIAFNHSLLSISSLHQEGIRSTFWLEEALEDNYAKVFEINNLDDPFPVFFKVGFCSQSIPILYVFEFNGKIISRIGRKATAEEIKKYWCYWSNFSTYLLTKQDYFNYVTLQWKTDGLTIPNERRRAKKENGICKTVDKKRVFGKVGYLEIKKGINLIIGLLHFFSPKAVFSKLSVRRS